jgi:branched-chain amino acid transport system permease protein
LRAALGLSFWRNALALAFACLIAATLALRAIHNDYAYFVAYVIFQYGALAIAWNILGGYAGYANFGAGAFFAAGAYATVALDKALGLPLIACLGAAGLLGGALGLLMGALTLRLRGVYFSISTLSLSVVLQTIVLNWPYVGGSSGAYLVRPKSISPFASYSEFLCLLMLAIATAAAIVAAAIERSSIGLGLTTIRDDEIASEALGVPTLRLKLAAATISGAIMSVAGAPLPYYNSYINPDSAFALGYTINAMAMPLVGGMQNWLGPVVGALLLGSAQQLAVAFISSAASSLLVGAIFMAFVAVAPRGLLGLVSGDARGAANS